MGIRRIEMSVIGLYKLVVHEAIICLCPETLPKHTNTRAGRQTGRQRGRQTGVRRTRRETDHLLKTWANAVNEDKNRERQKQRHTETQISPETTPGTYYIQTKKHRDRGKLTIHQCHGNHSTDSAKTI